jgi:hypothetical protein
LRGSSKACFLLGGHVNQGPKGSKRDEDKISSTLECLTDAAEHVEVNYHKGLRLTLNKHVGRQITNARDIVEADRVVTADTYFRQLIQIRCIGTHLSNLMLSRLPPFIVRSRRPSLLRKILMPSLTGPRPVDWKSAAPPIPNFAPQHDSLPRLPVPNLTATLERLKTSLLPLAHSKSEFTDAAKKIDAFGSDAGLGNLLQSRLLQRANEREHWLEEWWDNLGYLGYRDSVCPTCQ